MEMYYSLFAGMLFVLGTILVLLDLLMQDIAETRGIMSFVGIIIISIAVSVLLTFNNTQTETKTIGKKIEPLIVNISTDDEKFTMIKNRCESRTGIYTEWCIETLRDQYISGY